MPELSENISQAKAINHFQGPALVLAGPGSGKTFVITKRIQALIEQHQVRPEDILVVTFTRAAASEMKERFLRMQGNSGAGVSFATFHACFYSILRRACYPMRLSLLGEQEKRIQVREGLRRYGMEQAEINQDTSRRRGEWSSPSPEKEEAVLQDLSRYKSSGLKMSAYEPLAASKGELTYVWQFLEQYKQTVQKIDFDDMALQCYNLFRQKPEVLAHWQEKFSYILVDEFQDIDELQYRVLKLLAGQKKNLFVVGDDDQSIYGFRGARPEIMKRFLTDFPDAARMVLEQNYRCSGNIVTAAGMVIGENKDRMEKQIQAVREAGESVRIREFENREAELDFLMQEFARICSQGEEAMAQTAVIFRTNREMAAFAGRMVKCKLPFWMKESGHNLFETALARDIRTYLQFAQGERYRNDFYRIMNRPLRYIPRDIVKDHVVNLSNLLHDCERYYPSLIEEVEKLVEDMERMRTLQPYAAIQYLRKGVGYDDYIRTLPDATDKLELAEQIKESARGFTTLTEWEGYMEEYAAKLSQNSEEQGREEKAGIRLMTMHASKGLEYERVYLPHVNEGSVPNKRSTEPAELEEERRMFYVSMTRAKDSLCMTYRQDKQKGVSRFLEPLVVTEKKTFPKHKI